MTVLLPVGQFAGEFYLTPNAQGPDQYQVRLGDDVHRLTPAMYNAWVVAHGDPYKYLAGEEASRVSFSARARELGVSDVGSQLSELQKIGLVVQVLPVGSQLQRFAQDFRVRCIGVGLGNTREHPAALRIGFPGGQLRIAMPQLVWNVWLFSDRFDSLWDTCLELAPLMVGTNGGPADPMDVLKEFFAALPALIAVNCAYLDRR